MCNLDYLDFEYVAERYGLVCLSEDVYGRIVRSLREIAWNAEDAQAIAKECLSLLEEV